MKPPITNPLDQSHCDCLTRVLDSIGGTRQLIEQCKACGLPVDDFENLNNQQEQLAKDLKRIFFPLSP